MLLDEFAKPKLLIHKRSLKLLDHQRSRKFSIDSSPAFQDYHTLSLVLTDELPVFLTAIRQAFDTIVVALAHLQSATFAKFHKTFEQFQGNCFDSLEANRTIMGQFWQQYSSFADMLDSFTSTSTGMSAALDLSIPLLTQAAQNVSLRQLACLQTNWVVASRLPLLQQALLLVQRGQEHRPQTQYNRSARPQQAYTSVKSDLERIRAVCQRLQHDRSRKILLLRTGTA